MNRLNSLEHALTLPILRLRLYKHKDTKIFENHLNPVILVFIKKLSQSTLRWVLMCQGFNQFPAFLHHFVLAKFATSSRRVNLYMPIADKKSWQSWWYFINEKKSSRNILGSYVILKSIDISPLNVIWISSLFLFFWQHFSMPQDKIGLRSLKSTFNHFNLNDVCYDLTVNNNAYLESIEEGVEPSRMRMGEEKMES